MMPFDSNPTPPRPRYKFTQQWEGSVAAQGAVVDGLGSRPAGAGPEPAPAPAVPGGDDRPVSSADGDRHWERHGKFAADLLKARPDPAEDPAAPTPRAGLLDAWHASYSEPAAVRDALGQLRAAPGQFLAPGVGDDRILVADGSRPGQGVCPLVITAADGTRW
ncbi:MAG: hypothetical protein C0501_27210, partial [Isosphaera sp.]|nr:hypothetical protein [Isosphaera sp.]